MNLPKGSAAYTAAEAKVQTVFQGTTLRGLLLEAYGFSLIAEIAFWCAIAAFCLAGVMAVLVGLGFAHARRTDEKRSSSPATRRRRPWSPRNQSSLPSGGATPGPRSWAGCARVRGSVPGNLPSI